MNNKTLFGSLLLINFIALVFASPVNLNLELTSQVHTTDVKPRVESQDRTFSFTLSSCTFVLRSNTQSSSSDCTKTKDGSQLIISGVFENPESVDLSMIVLTPTTIGSALKSQVFNVLSVFIIFTSCLRISTQSKQTGRSALSRAP